MLKCPKQLPNCLKRTETSLVLIVFRHWLRLPGLGNNNEKLGLPERLSAGVIWYFEPHGKLNPGSIYIHGILNPLLKIEPLLYGK